MLKKLKISVGGESHGKSLTGIIEGLPSNIIIDSNFIDYHLSRRQKGYGRGKRMNIEEDKTEILAGVRNGKTIGSSVVLQIQNKDYENWKEEMSIESNPDIEPIQVPRANHADVPGYFKFETGDIRNSIEISSARITAIYTALGGIAALFLRQFGINFFSHVKRIGSVEIPENDASNIINNYNNDIRLAVYKSPVRCAVPGYDDKMISEIDSASKEKDTLGGIVQLLIMNVPIGLGSCTSIDRRLDSRLSAFLTGIPSVKGIFFGSDSVVNRRGSEVLDYLGKENSKLTYQTNMMGGINGGISNGNTIYADLYIKPVPTLAKSIKSVNLSSKRIEKTHKERADVCVVPVIGPIAESMAALVIADAFLEKFGGDSLEETKESFRSFMEKIKKDFN